MGREREPGDDNRDDELLGELRRVVTDIDPVPQGVTSFARTALGWRRIDAELAELLVDSALETESLAHTRSGFPASRAVTFSATGLEIDLEIQRADPGVVVLGQLAPPVRAAVEMQRDDDSVAATTETDALGRFRVELATLGRIRLRISQADAESTVETSWFGL